jgi:phosphate transport system substrate-binding protein
MVRTFFGSEGQVDSNSDLKVLREGTLIGGAYRIVRPIAEGGMGLVYEVEQTATGARRALKVMHGRFAGDAGLRARFVREARLAAAIPSDHVALVVDAGQDESTGALYIVMELLDGSTLAREVRRMGAFPWAAARAVLGQIAHALGAAHALGVVHRDLKPANVFLARSRHATLPFTVKLLDFGIAKAMAGTGEATMSVLGTPAWMAPEQTRVDVPVGPQADVWSFGLLAFLLLTGRHYFASANSRSAVTAAVLREVILDPLVPASERAAELDAAGRLPAGFDEWFAKCVDRIADHRFADAREAYDALAALPAPEAAAVSASWENWGLTSRPPIETSMPEDAPTALEAAAQRPVFADRSTMIHASSTVSTPTPPVRAPSFVRVLWLAAALFAGVSFVLWAGSRLRSREAASPSAEAATRAPTSSVADVRLHGSNTIGSEFVPALAEAFLAKRTGAKAVVRRRTAPDELVVEARNGDRVVESIEVYAHGTATAFEDLQAGRCDIGMASRRIRADEVTKLLRLGDLSSAASEHVVALDGIAVIVNPSNPVSALTKAQIAGVFSGAIRRWSEAGGPDEAIVVHARDDKSGTYDTFKHVVLGDGSLVSGAVRHESSEELSDAVAADPRAVGFIGLPYIRSAKAVMVQDEGSIPLLPSPMTVSTEDYPLARRLYLYLPLAASEAARDFVDFAQSEEGQRLAQATGFVDLRASCDPNVPRGAAASRDYRESVRGACRLSMDFRFERGSTQLDTRALTDLQRVVALTGRPEYAARSLLLFGFSDATGTRSDNAWLAQQRADIVAGQLRARGLRVDVSRGFGAEMPIADDHTEEGRERNRRVEVWLH